MLRKTMEPCARKKELGKRKKVRRESPGARTSFMIQGRVFGEKFLEKRRLENDPEAKTGIKISHAANLKWESEH